MNAIPSECFRGYDVVIAGKKDEGWRPRETHAHYENDSDYIKKKLRQKLTLWPYKTTRFY